MTDLEKKFEQSYKNLNPEQKKAVDTIEGPVMVIAGPGTGKTTVLTLRIANILKRTDTPPHGILAITYTDAGVKAMREKLHAIIGNRAHEVNIHTFHSFARAMISEYPDHFLHLEDRAIITDVEKESVVRAILTETRFSDLRPIGKPEAYVSAILRAIDDAKREALLPNDIRTHAQAEIIRIQNDEGAISTRGATKGQLKADAKELIEKCQRTLLFADVYESYEKEKLAKKRMDFNDLILELLVTLRNDQLFLRLIQERFLYLLVDEHQDTNDAQNFIVALIAEFFETPNIFIVGDEKQAIYRFQGASVENFLLLRKRWPAMKLISLDTNYRSHQKLLDAGFAMIEKNYDGDEHSDLRVKLTAGGKIPSQPVEVSIGENARAIEQELIKQLERITKAEPAATVAIITRRNRDLERVLHLLESNNIPVSSERSLNIFNHPVGSLFFDLIDYLANSAETDALARTIAAGMWGISFDESVTIIRRLRSGNTSGLEKDIPALVILRKKLLDDSAVGFIVNAAELSGFAALMARDPAFVHVWRGIVALAESITREGSITEPLKLMQAMLDHRLSAESRTVKVSVGAPDLPIKAMTAHGSKGLEFDYVFMPYATEEAWVGRTRGSSFVLPEKRIGDGDIRDIRRLFYVALTRAKKHAVILVPLEESDGRALTPLRFISELDEASVATLNLARADADMPEALPQKAAEKTQETYSKKMTAFAKQVLLDTGLSVTALNHFLDCPNKFLYESILKLPQAPSASAEKGTAMHEAISAIWQEEDRGALHIEKIIIDKISEYLTDSFLPAREKESVKAELIENAPIVAKALAEHFNAKGSVLTESFIKTTFDGTYQGERVAIPIHGLLDAVVDTGSNVSVFDYKTRQGMSVAEIKGETKNSNGDYFRQLTYYKILVMSDHRFRMKKINTGLVFVSPDKKGRCPIVELEVMQNDIEAVRQQIQSVIDSVWSGTIAGATCTDPDCAWCGLMRISRY